MCGGGDPKFFHLCPVLHPQLWAEQQGLSQFLDSNHQPLSLEDSRCPDMLVPVLTSLSPHLPLQPIPSEMFQLPKETSPSD